MPIDTTSVKVVEYVHQDWKLFLDALVGIGTILLAIVTVFGENLKRWVLKTTLNYKIEDGHPFIEQRKIKNDEGSLQETIKIIRMKVGNNKGRAATNCQGVVSKIYTLVKNTTKYKETSFSPGMLKWNNDSDTIVINKAIDVYLEVAKICKPHVETQESDTVAEGNPEQNTNNKLFLLVKDRNEGEEEINLGEGNFIIPVRIIGDNIKKPEEKYIRIIYSNEERNEEKLSISFIQKYEFHIED